MHMQVTIVIRQNTDHIIFHYVPIQKCQITIRWYLLHNEYLVMKRFYFIFYYFGQVLKIELNVSVHGYRNNRHRNKIMKTFSKYYHCHHLTLWSPAIRTRPYSEECSILYFSIYGRSTQGAFYHNKRLSVPRIIWLSHCHVNLLNVTVSFYGMYRCGFYLEKRYRA